MYNHVTVYNEYKQNKYNRKDGWITLVPRPGDDFPKGSPNQKVTQREGKKSNNLVLKI